MSAFTNLFADGEVYERLMGRWSRRVGDLFLDWLDQPNGLRWLDVGCGNGAFTEAVIASAAPRHVSGIDPSEGQIDYARKRPGAASAEFRVGDAQVLPYGDASFDVTAMALVIAFVPEPAKAVAEMARVTRPGGTVATYMWDFVGGGGPITPIYLALRSLGIERPMPPSAESCSQAALRDLWHGAGLERVETRVIHIAVEFADFEDFWASNAVPSGPQGMLISRMSADQKERLRDRLREQLPAGPDGRIVYESFANAVQGRVPG